MEKDLSTWVETKTADNKVYYYNSATRETSWKRPENVRIVKYDQLMAAAMAAAMANAATASTIVAATATATNNNNITSTYTTTSSITNTTNNHPSLLGAAIAPATRGIGQLATEAPAEAAIVAAKPQLLLATATSSQLVPAISATAAPATAVVSTTNSSSSITTTNKQLTSTSAVGISSNNNNSGKNFNRSSSIVSNDNNSSNSNFCNNNGNNNTSSNNKKEGMKPVSTTAIPGTAWCVVWTDKNRVFYFNPSTKTSVWDRPAELRNRDDVDKIISNPPPIVQQQQQQNKQDQDSEPQLSSSNGDQQAEKKVKLDNSNSNNTNCNSLDSASATNSTANSTTTNTTTTTSSNTTLKPIIAPKIVKKEVATEMEKEAAKKRETISFEERVATFRQMLEEKEVNPSSTFQRELSKIVFDPRYLLLTSNERRETFEKYCLEKGEEERKARREKMKKAAESFKELLREASLTSRSIYEDFHDKYSKDPRYRALERTKDREILFDDHLAMLRRKEREERSQSKRSERHHIKRKRSIAEENFRQLLRETKLIDKNTRRKIEESEHQHLIDIIGTLQNHKRYLDLEPYSEKRRKILLSYIEELAASNP